MHRSWRITVLVVVGLSLVGCKDVFDLDVRQKELAYSLYWPEGWSPWRGGGHLLGMTNDTYEGGTAAYIRGRSERPEGAGIFTQMVRADAYRGKRVRLSAWLKPIEVTNSAPESLGTLSGIWMRVDGPGSIVGLDDMRNRPVLGSGGWSQYAVVLDVPQDAVGIAMGAIMRATGLLEIDDVRFEVVGTNIATTNRLLAPIKSDSATVEYYGREGDVLINTNFEGIPSPTATTIDWLRSATLSLATADPNAPLDDLQPLKSMIGNAHIVGMGEGTHGTREYFLMKARILKYLVTEMGFTHFAIEATSPEADDVNRFVLTGAGDPRKLLSRLYFWTWNTQEVLDMILWMREWNTTAPESRRVQFLGFDIQSPGASIDSVTAFVARVSPARNDSVARRYGCLNPYRNHGPIQTLATADYPKLDITVRSACAAGLKEVYDIVSAARSELASAAAPATEDEFQRALHYARLVQQYETMLSGTEPWFRDIAMAENVKWILDRNPGARIALWAHNGHISRVPSFLGYKLGVTYGSDYVTIGTLMGAGAINALTASGSLKPTASASAQNPLTSLEAQFGAIGKSIALFDARKIPSGGAAAAPLAGPVLMRTVGSVYNTPTNTYIESQSFANQILPRDFDLLIYFQKTTATTLLPFIY